MGSYEKRLALCQSTHACAWTGRQMHLPYKCTITTEVGLHYLYFDMPS
jgi:hypothetical protein